jgi:hypothetical protein
VLQRQTHGEEGGAGAWRAPLGLQARGSLAWLVRGFASRLCAVLCAGLSLTVVLSIAGIPILEKYGLSLSTYGTAIAVSGQPVIWLELLAFGPLLYSGLCVTYALFSVKLYAGFSMQPRGAGRSRSGVQGAHLNPLRPLLTHPHTVYMACSECLPTHLNPLAERTCSPQARWHRFQLPALLRAAALPACGAAGVQLSPPGERDTKLAQKLGQLQPFIAVYPQESMGQLASFGPS